MFWKGRQATMNVHAKAAADKGGADLPAEGHRRASSQEPVNCEIKVEGYLESHWSEWFDGWRLTYDERDDTIISGLVPDQAALHGARAKIRDLGLPLLSVNRTCFGPG
jgi:hypothetical protein